MNTDMTKGDIRGILRRFSLPIILSTALLQLYGLADSAVVGRFAGSTAAECDAAVAAVGVASMITLVFVAVSNGLNNGCSVVISRLFGKKDYKSLKDAVATSIAVFLGISLLLAVLGIAFCDTLLAIMDTPREIIPDARAYLTIYCCSLPLLFLYNACNGVFTSLGDSRTPLWFLTFSSVLNVALDLVFVINLSAGVPGVAWATLIAQGVSALLSFAALVKRIRSIPSDKSKPRFSRSIAKELSALSLPSVVQQSTVHVGNLFVQSLINGYGASLIAGFSVAMKINAFATACFVAVSSAVSAFTAQNIGARDLERVKKGFKAGVRITLFIVTPVALCFFIFAPQLVQVCLADKSDLAVAAGSSFLRFVAPFYFIINVKVITDGILRGAGKMKYFAASTVADLILRVALSYLLLPIMGLQAVASAWAVGWVVAGAMSAVFYAKGVWRRGLENEENPAS